MKKELFSIDVLGLRETQLGKPKYIVIRELLQNALDEQTTTCEIKLRYEHGKAKITVSDDSPEGFKDLSDSYTLFASTTKRNDVKKRGRFNFGEKQVICLCDYARIISTKGGIEFFVLAGERKDLRQRREAGSQIYVELKMTHDEYWECINYCDEIIVPQNINVRVYYSEPNMDGLIEKVLDRQTSTKIFSSILPTEIKTHEGMKIKKQSTDVHLYTPRGEKAFIHELGIPICEIDCQYSIDVQQKVPLSNDRDKVDSKYLKTLYAEVLNQVFDEIKELQSSSTWVRSAIETGTIKQDAILAIVKERYGNKVVISNPFDAISDDDAKANGYKLIYGNELSAEERDMFKKDGIIKTSTQLLGVKGLPSTHVAPSKHHLVIYALTERIAGEFLGFKPIIYLVDCQGATVLATFGDGAELTFYNNIIPTEWWLPDSEGYVSDEMLELIIHELCHKFGHHCDRSYLDKITWLASKLIRKERAQKSFFKIN